MKWISTALLCFAVLTMGCKGSPTSGCAGGACQLEHQASAPGMTYYGSGATSVPDGSYGTTGGSGSR